MSITRGLPSIYSRLNSSKIIEVKLVQLYYLIDGRNAWWQTWVQRYRQDCMQVDLNAAQKVCERKRVQGTVFRISQLPAIAFRSLNGSLLVTQINTDSPLSQLRLHRLEGALELIRQAEELRLIREKKEAKVISRQKGIYLGDINQIMNVVSDIYLPTMPRENSVMVLFASNLTRIEAMSTSSAFQSWQSEGVGREYYLSWSQTSRSFDVDILFQVSTAFQSYLQKLTIGVE